MDWVTDSRESARSGRSAPRARQYVRMQNSGAFMNTRLKRLAIASALIVLIAAVAFLLESGPGKGGGSTLDDNGRAAPRSISEHSATHGNGDPGSGSQGARTTSPPVVRVSLAEEFRMAPNLRAFYDRHLHDDRPEAVYFRGRALALCVDYVTSPAHEVERRFSALGSADHPKFRERLQSLKAISRKCGDFFQVEMPDLARMFADAAARGFPPAIAMTLLDMMRNGKDSDSKAAELLQLDDPEVVERVMPYLALRTRFALGDPNLTPRPAIVQDAWQLYMCTIGADCSATSRYLLDQCRSEGLCGAASVEQFFQAIKYSPSDFQDLVRAQVIIQESIQRRDWRAIGLSPR